MQNKTLTSKIYESYVNGNPDIEFLYCCMLLLARGCRECTDCGHCGRPIIPGICLIFGEFLT